MSKPKKPDNPPVPVEPSQPAASPESKPTMSGTLTAASKTEFFTGPLPHPDYLQQYEQIYPGAAQIIFTTFQQLAAHQMEMEKQALDSDTRRSSLGIVAGFLIAVALIVGGFVAICLGHDWAGATVIVSCIVGLAGVFVYGTQSRKKQESGDQDKQSNA
jgi:uncharacterized membrane protein